MGKAKKNQTRCHVCEREFKDGDEDDHKEVIDHDHFPGAFKGMAHKNATYC